MSKLKKLKGSKLSKLMRRFPSGFQSAQPRGSQRGFRKNHAGKEDTRTRRHFTTTSRSPFQHGGLVSCVDTSSCNV